MKASLVFIALFSSLTSFAGNSQIVCQETPGQSHGSVWMELDSVPGSNFYGIGRVQWSFQYSMASLICSKDMISLSRTESLHCIGYNSAGGLTEIALVLNGGVGTAKVRSIGKNVYSDQTDGMVLPCRAKYQSK